MNYYIYGTIKNLKQDVYFGSVGILCIMIATAFLARKFNFIFPLSLY